MLAISASLVADIPCPGWWELVVPSPGNLALWDQPGHFSMHKRKVASQQHRCPEHSAGQAVVFPGRRAIFAMQKSRRAACRGPGAPGRAGSSVAWPTSRKVSCAGRAGQEPNSEGWGSSVWGWGTVAALNDLRESRLATLNFTKGKQMQNSRFPQGNLKVAVKSVKDCFFGWQPAPQNLSRCLLLFLSHSELFSFYSCVLSLCAFVPGMLKDAIILSLELCWHTGQEGEVSARVNNFHAWPWWWKERVFKTPAGRAGSLGKSEFAKKKKKSVLMAVWEWLFLFASGVFSLPCHADHPARGQGSCSSCLWRSGECVLAFFPVSFPHPSPIHEFCLCVMYF